MQLTNPGTGRPDVKMFIRLFRSGDPGGTTGGEAGAKAPSRHAHHGHHGHLEIFRCWRCESTFHYHRQHLADGKWLVCLGCGKRDRVRKRGGKFIFVSTHDHPPVDADRVELLRATVS